MEHDYLCGFGLVLLGVGYADVLRRCLVLRSVMRNQNTWNAEQNGLNSLNNKFMSTTARVAKEHNERIKKLEGGDK